MSDGRKIADNVEALTGWRPPVFYDINNDMFRVATQEDVDRLRRIADESTKALAKIREALRDMEEANPSRRGMTK